MIRPYTHFLERIKKRRLYAAKIEGGWMGIQGNVGAGNDIYGVFIQM